jgi:hypothetical protein
MPELVQGGAAGGLGEQGSGLLIGQPGPAGGVRGAPTMERPRATTESGLGEGAPQC